MVNERYMLHKRPPPASVKSFINEDVIPAAIDVAGALETVGEFLAIAARRYPLTMLAASFGAGVFITRRRRAKPTPAPFRARLTPAR